MTARGARYPDFLCIGAQKTGTSWLYRNLSVHPDVWLPKVKELHYFDQKMDLERQHIWAKLFDKDPVYARWRHQFSRRLIRRDVGPLKLRDLPWYWRFFFRRASDRWYASLFATAGDKLAGEITPYYAALPPERVAHIHRLMPDARILFFLRNPIERSWSQGMMFARKKGVKEFAAVMRNLEAEHTRERNDYLTTLEIWSRHYPEERIFVGFLEDVRHHPETLLERVHAFLGIRDVGPNEYTRTPVNRGTHTTMPRDVAVWLAEQDAEVIARLGDAIGGYASWWNYTCERLLAEGAEGEIDLPFEETELWDDWRALTGNGAGPPPVQSGPLPQVLRVRATQRDVSG
jgi:hypothetical protein